MESAGELSESMRGIVRWKHGRLKLMHIIASRDYFIRSGEKWRLIAWGLHLSRKHPVKRRTIMHTARGKWIGANKNTKENKKINKTMEVSDVHGNACCTHNR